MYIKLKNFYSIPYDIVEQIKLKYKICTCLERKSERNEKESKNPFEGQITRLCIEEKNIITWYEKSGII